jgi:hypothetical protein
VSFVLPVDNVELLAAHVLVPQLLSAPQVHFETSIRKVSGQLRRALEQTLVCRLQTDLVRCNRGPALLAPFLVQVNHRLRCIEDRGLPSWLVSRTELDLLSSSPGMSQD